MAAPPSVILFVWLHGFKGGADTFSNFPEQLLKGLCATTPDSSVVDSTSTIEEKNAILLENVLYPPYDTRGELDAATEHHLEWLAQLVETKKELYPNRSISVILLGHSMGGLVIADTLRVAYVRKIPINFLGLIAYDTPYFGLNPRIFKNTFERVSQQGQTILAGLGLGFGALRAFASPSHAQAETSSRSTQPQTPKAANSKEDEEVPPANGSFFTSATGLALAGAAVAAISGTGYGLYANRQLITDYFNWATSHLSYVGELWKEGELRQRMADVYQITQETGVEFHCFYTLLPGESSARPGLQFSESTFIILPSQSRPEQMFERFYPNLNTRADGEIGAHVDMFEERSDGLDKLDEESCQILSVMIEKYKRRTSTSS